MKEIIITMEKDIGVKQTSTNGDAIKNEASAKAPEQAPKKSWWDRQSDGVQTIVTFGATFGAFVALCFVGGAVSAAVKESSARKTLNSEGFKEHDRLVSEELKAKIARGLFDEPKTLEEAAARMLEKNSRQQIIVIDPYEMSQMNASN